MKLDVRVNGRKVASLFREADNYILLYDQGVAADDLVSLAMPVRTLPWVWPRDLHPFFRQNLPEGYLLGVLRELFGRYLDGTDMSLLALVGGTGIGRVTVMPAGKTDAHPVTALDLAGVLHGDNSEVVFGQMVREYALSAVSGVYPKFLSPNMPAEKTTLRIGRHLVKGSGSKTPFLGLNEHYTLEVLRRTRSIPVVESQLSDDGRVLVVTRFDVDAPAPAPAETAGQSHCAIEDACGLLGRPPHEKYASTTEEVIKAIKPYFAKETAQQQLEYLGWLILSSYVVRNADMHTKNIALRYTNARDVCLAPAYDLVTTQAYPDFAKNPPGLSVDGRKSWAAGKALQRLFSTRLNISPRQFVAMVEQLCDAATDTGRELIVAGKDHPEWRDVVRNMLHAWNDGMESIRSAKPQPALRALAADLDAARMGERDMPTKPTVIGKSNLLGKGRPF